MSDVEYEDDDFDNDDDLYWIGDGVIDIADDLAEHSMPSPVFHDDLQTFMFEDYSDWENYSDDYYDDDPSVLRTAEKVLESHDGRASTRSDRVLKQPKHTVKQAPKKRKGAASNLPVEDCALEEIIWRSKVPVKVNEHVPGRLERVSLLKNWREVFRDARQKSRKNQKERSRSSSSLRLDKSLKRRRNVDEQKPAEGLVSLSPDEEENRRERSPNSRYTRKRRHAGRPDIGDENVPAEKASTSVPNDRPRQHKVQIEELTVRAADSAGETANSSNLMRSSTRRTGKRLRSEVTPEEMAGEPSSKRSTGRKPDFRPISNERDRKKQASATVLAENTRNSTK